MGTTSEPGIACIPNLLSLSRLLATPPLCAAIALGAWGPALGLWAWVSITDWLDGALARAWNQTSALGRVLDPLADKVAVLGTLVCLIPAGIAGGYLAPWMVALLIGREFIVTGLRSEMERLGKPFGADAFGKVKMVAQVVAIWMALVLEWLGKDDRHGWMDLALAASVWIMLAAALVSGIHYGWQAYGKRGRTAP